MSTGFAKTKHVVFRASLSSPTLPCLPAAAGEKSPLSFSFGVLPIPTPRMSHRPQSADTSDALMTELATIPNNLGFLVFDLTGKKVPVMPPLLIGAFCNSFAARIIGRA